MAVKPLHSGLGLAPTLLGVQNSRCWRPCAVVEAMPEGVAPASVARSRRRSAALPREFSTTVADDAVFSAHPARLTARLKLSPNRQVVHLK